MPLGGQRTPGFRRFILAMGDRRGSALPIIIAVTIGLTIGAVGGVTLWALRQHVWFWVWIGLIAYMLVAGVASSRSRQNPWSDFRPAWLPISRSQIDYARKQWDRQHGIDSENSPPNAD
jgi:hypothetical protein